VNGSPSAEFIPQRGLMRKAVEKNLFRGFPVGSNNVRVSILQYADDSIFFGEASMENVKAIKVILRTFKLVLGLKINFAKSCFGAIGVSDRWKQVAANYLNCSLLAFSFIYLGIPIRENPRRCQLWDPIIDKCERQLTKWKQRHISFGG